MQFSSRTFSHLPVSSPLQGPQQGQQDQAVHVAKKRSRGVSKQEGEGERGPGVKREQHGDEERHLR